MTRKKAGNSFHLREKAERKVPPVDVPENISGPDARRLIHELQVHRVELEAQMDELRETQELLEKSRAKYSNLYDYAPVGYLTLDAHGIIVEANLTAAEMLGVARDRLISARLESFLWSTTSRSLYLHLRKVFGTKGRQMCEVELKGSAGRKLYAQLDSLWVEDGPQCWTSLTDISERKEAEKALRESEKQLRHLSTRLLSVREAERERIAEELHDNIIQTLATIKLSVENALKAGEKDEAERMRESLEALVPVLQRTLDGVRGAYMDLLPPLLKDFGVIAALEWVCREFAQANSAISVSRQIGAAEEDIPQSLKLMVFRVVQETLLNVARHSNARSVAVRLAKVGGTISLTVRDDGDGFDLGEALSLDNRDSGIGLASLKQQIASFKGDFHIEPVPGKGTTVRATLPCLD